MQPLASSRPTVVNALPTVPEPVPSDYRLGCGDVLKITFGSHPQWDCFVSLSVDGTAPIGWANDPVVVGATLSEAISLIDSQAPEPVNAVILQLIETRSGHIYLSGPENYQQRMLLYHGPETVIQFLIRSGALQPGCTNLKNVQVVRPNVAIGMTSVEYEVNIEAIVQNGDLSSDVRLQPSDHVYVGEMWRSRLSRLLPDWMRPSYRILAGIIS